MADARFRWSLKKRHRPSVEHWTNGGPLLAWIRFKCRNRCTPWALTGEERKSKIEGDERVLSVSTVRAAFWGEGHPTDTAKKHQTLITNMAWIWRADSRWRWGFAGRSVWVQGLFELRTLASHSAALLSVCPEPSPVSPARQGTLCQLNNTSPY